METEIEFYKHLYRINKQLGNKTGEEAACDLLGNAYYSLGDFKQAIEYHKQCLNIAKEQGDGVKEGAACSKLGNDYWGLSNFKQAIEYHEQHLNIAKDLGDRAGEGRAYGNLGIAYNGLSDLRRAIEYQTQCLSIAKELGDKDGEGHAYTNLGLAYWYLGDSKQAMEYHTQSLSIAKEQGNRAGEGSAYANLGIAYNCLGDFKQAIECHTQDLNIAKELGNRAGEGGAYANLGNAYQSIGEFKQAVEYHTQHLSTSKLLGDRAGEGAAYGNLGNAHQSLGDITQGIEYHTQRLRTAKELGVREAEGRANGNLGVAYHKLGKLEQAIEYHTKDLNIAKELGVRAAEGRAYGNLGAVYQNLGNFKQAIVYHKEGLSIFKELGDKAGEANLHYLLGSDFELSGALEEALDCYQASVKLSNDVRALLQSEDVWKVTFRNASQRTYAALCRTLVRLEKTDEALCVAEQGRAQALVELMKLQYDSKLVVSGSLEPKVAISRILSVTCTQTVFVVLECNKIYLWVLCKGTNVQFRQNEVEEDAATFLECIRKSVFQENAITARVTCENRSLDELRKKLPPSKEFEQETVKASQCENNSLRTLHDCIIGPVADLLQGGELVIVPDGPLCLAPYAALLDGKSRYLSESVRIRIAPSLTSLKLIADSAENYHSTSGALLVGDPCVEEVTNERGERILSPLLYARREVKMIGGMLGIKPLIGKKATKEEVLKRIGSVALIHIAAHGDMKSGEIALAPNPVRKSKIPEEGDFMLKMADVKAVQLRARLVVLSCCYSAQGMVTPEDVVCIARTFLSFLGPWCLTGL